MDYVTFGRTGLKVSVMGLGSGGPSRIGQATAKSEAESIAIVHGALDAGVNFIDTAEAYGTEALLGKALHGIDRQSVILSTKKSHRQEISPALVRQGVEASLKRLQTDYIDIYSLHGVAPNEYPKLRDEILPTFFDLRQEGKMRFIGVTEMFNEDKTHQMMVDSAADDPWDVAMIGFNILNQTARQHVFPATIKRNVAVQIMFAVRLALSQRDKLIASLQELINLGQLESSEVDLKIHWTLCWRNRMPAVSSTLPIAFVATNQGFTSYCRVQATPITCKPISIRSAARRCRKVLCKNCVTFSAMLVQ